MPNDRKKMTWQSFSTAQWMTFSSFMRVNQFRVSVRLGLSAKYFLSFPQKNLPPEKTETNKYLLFNFWRIRFTVIPKNAIWQFSKIAVLVNFIVQKLRSKHLVCLRFLWWDIFFREWEKYFADIPDLKHFERCYCYQDMHIQHNW